MKKIVSIIGIILIFVSTPLPPIFMSLLIPKLSLSGCHGNIFKGYIIDSLSYNGILASKITINNKLEFSAENLFLKKVSAKNIHGKIYRDFIDISFNIYGGRINGKIYNYGNIKFLGEWQKLSQKIQKISVKQQGQILLIETNGILGKSKIRYNQNIKLLAFELAEFDISALIGKSNSQNLLAGKGELKLDDLSGNLYLQDKLNNSIQIYMEDSTPKISINMNSANFWLGNYIKTVIGVIELDKFGKLKNTKLTIKAFNDYLLDISANHETANAVISRKNAIVNLKFKYIKNGLATPNLNEISAIWHSVKTRLTKQSITRSNNNNISNLIIKASGSDPDTKTNFALHGNILFNPQQPEATELYLHSDKFSTLYAKRQLIVKKADLESSSEKNHFKLNGFYNNKPIAIQLSAGKIWEFVINAKDITIPFSNNTSLIISPNISVNRFDNEFYVSGDAEISGGLIRTTAHDNIVDMPANVTIIGDKTDDEFFHLFTKNISGSIHLYTTNFIDVENLGGLNGQLTGDLILHLAKNSEPRFDGKIQLHKPNYLNNKRIIVDFAKATYENNVITNPFLDIKLTREISQPSFDLSSLATINKKQKVGIKVHGSVSQPEITTFSTMTGLSKLQTISALETGSTNGISPEQGVLSIFSIMNNTKQKESPLESIQDAFSLDEIYFSSNNPNNHDLINPNLSDSAIVLTKTLLDNVKATYLASLHNKDYLINVSYYISDKININLYSSHVTQANLASNNDNYGINILLYNTK